MDYQKLNHFLLPLGFRGRSALTVQLWWLIQSTLFALSPPFMSDWRRLLLKAFGAEIGSDVVISQKSYLSATTHDYTKSSFDMIDKKITIEDQVWLATDVFVAPGVTVGRGSLVGARSSVFNDMPEGMICLGTPAKPIKPRI